MNSSDTTITHTHTYRDYEITITLDEGNAHLLAAPLLPEMTGWHDDAEFEASSLEEAMDIARESVDANYNLFESTNN